MTHASTAVTPTEFRLDSDEIQKDPFAYYPGLREQTPVLGTDMGGNPCWVLSRHEDIMMALRDTDTFSSRTVSVPTVLASDPPDQQRLRAMVADMFTRSAVEAMGPFIAERVSELLPPLIAAGRADVVNEFAGPLTVSVIARLLGIAVDDIEQLRQLTRLRALHVRAIRRGEPSPPEAQAANEQLSRFAAEIISGDRFDAESVVARLAALKAAGELTEHESSEYLVLLLVAGHTTTTNLIANAVYTLAQRPENLTRLREEPAFTPRFLEEVLRTRPSFQRIVRITTRDAVVSGATIPAGSMVYFLLGSANLDPEKIERPDEFDPDRRRAPHMTFGHGIHTCLGQWLARLEARTALIALAEHVGSIELDPELGPQHLSGGTGNEFGFEHLPVRLHGRAVQPVSEITTSHDALRIDTRGVAHELEIEVRVADKTVESDGVVSLELRSLDGAELPAWEPGAHIDLILDGAPTRQYSLCGDPADRDSWRVGVLREIESRGGSVYVHDTLQPGDTIRVRGPRNNFPLNASPAYLFIAGGIGITPILPMIRAAATAGADWELVYCGRGRDSMAFLDELAGYGQRVTVRPKDETGRLDLDQLLADPRARTEVYSCGPESLLAGIQERSAGWPAGAFHMERFHPRPVDATASTSPFEVTLAQSGITLTVEADQSILEAVEDAGVDVFSSCRVGTCGTCEVRVLAGSPDHRDSVLGEAERESNACLMVCVSRSLSPELTLDL